MIFIGEYKELNNDDNFPSMKDFFQKDSYEGKEKIIYYLQNGGKDFIVSASYPHDVFSGESVPGEEIGRKDDKYIWFSTLSHYVDKYNLRLPKDFEEHILNQ